MIARLILLGLVCAAAAAVSLDLSQKMYAITEEPDPVELAPRGDGCYTDGGAPR